MGFLAGRRDTDFAPHECPTATARPPAGQRALLSKKKPPLAIARSGGIPENGAKNLPLTYRPLGSTGTQMKGAQKKASRGKVIHEKRYFSLGKQRFAETGKQNEDRIEPKQMYPFWVLSSMVF